MRTHISTYAVSMCRWGELCRMKQFPEGVAVVDGFESTRTVVVNITSGASGMQASAPFWIALGALVVSALSLGLTWWERRSNYRDALYSRQLAVFADVVGKAFELYWATANFILANPLPLSEEKRKVAGRLPEGDAFTRVVLMNNTILPTKVVERVLTFSAAVSAPLKSDQAQPWRDALKVANTELNELLELTRKLLGTEALSEETLKRLSSESQRVPTRL